MFILCGFQKKNQMRISGGLLWPDGLVSFEVIYGRRWSLISHSTATNESSRWQLIREGPRGVGGF